MNSKLFNFKHYPIIQEQLGDVTSDPYKHFFTKGRWSTHETILYLLKQSGPAKVSIASFSLSEITIRTFANAIKAGYITNIELLLNTAVKRNKLDLLLFLKNVVTRIGLIHNHQKIILIESNTHFITVTQSANSTINPAHESGVVFSTKNDFDIYRKQLDIDFKQAMIL